MLTVSVTVLRMTVTFCGVYVDSECDSSQYQAIVNNGTSLIYSWFIDSELIAVTTNNQVTILISLTLPYNTNYSLQSNVL